MTTEPAVIIVLEGNGHAYRPGEAFSGAYWIDALGDNQIKAVEVSVLWHTEGKGDEDMAVHEFWRHDADEGRLFIPGQPEHFTTTLPNSPLSYNGQIVKIHWCVRIRAFLQRGREVVGQKMFQLGDVPSLKAESP